MPFINFMWYPTSDSERVAGIVGALRELADAHNLGFYVKSAEEADDDDDDDDAEADPVSVAAGLDIPAAVMTRLRGLAKAAGVTIDVSLGV